MPWAVVKTIRDVFMYTLLIIKQELRYVPKWIYLQLWYSFLIPVYLYIKFIAKHHEIIKETSGPCFCCIVHCWIGFPTVSFSSRNNLLYRLKRYESRCVAMSQNNNSEKAITIHRGWHNMETVRILFIASMAALL